MYIIAVDCETTHRGGPDHDSPEAQYPSNEVVRVGFKYYGKEEVHISSDFKDLHSRLTAHLEENDEVMLVGHNLKFDLKWFMRDYGPAAGFCRLWDTMTFEYLDSGHEEKFISLEAALKRRGIKATKTMDLGEYIAAGGRVQDIPLKELDEYLEADVRMVLKLALEQGLRYEEEIYNMYYIHALAEMELNGMPVDREGCQMLATTAADTCDRYVETCKTFIKKSAEWADGSPITDADFEKKIKPTANRTLSWMITGYPTEVRTTSDKWTFKYKDHRLPIMNLLSVGRVWTGKPNHLGHSMDEKHIDAAIFEHACDGLAHPVLVNLPSFRKNDKLLNTYYLPFLVQSEETGCIHPKLNTTATATGRLSSSKPNGQNLPTEARRLIVAQEGYKIVELDFSQLELVALASLCKDPQMLKDIAAGEDIHYNSGQRVMGWSDPSDMTKKDRTLVKNVNFGAVYGGKAPGLSMQTGVDKKIIQDLINSLYRRYPGIAEWQKATYENVVMNMEPNGHDDDGEQMYKSTIKEGDRKYTFFETPSPRWLRARTGRSYSFNPNQVYNYPIQGFAGWRIVLGYLGNLWAESNKDIKFLMTVHDSIVIMVPEDDVRIFQGEIEHEVKKLSRELGLPFDLQVSVEVGDNWS